MKKYCRYEKNTIIYRKQPVQLNTRISEFSQDVRLMLMIGLFRGTHFKHTMPSTSDLTS